MACGVSLEKCPYREVELEEWLLLAVFQNSVKGNFSQKIRMSLH